MCEKREFAGLLLPDRLPQTPKRDMTGPFLCRIAFPNENGAFVKDWAILDWTHSSDGEGKWNVDAYETGTEVTSWQPMPPIPTH